MAETDPFTTVHDRLLAVLPEDDDWATAFKVGKRATGDTGGAITAAVRKYEIGSGLFRIVPMVGGRFTLTGTSSGYQWIQNFALQITTDSPDFTADPDTAAYGRRLFALKWFTLKAIARARAAHGPHLGLPELVVDVQPIDVIESNESSDANRATRNWIGVVGVAVQMQFRKDTFTGA